MGAIPPIASVQPPPYDGISVVEAEDREAAVALARESAQREGASEIAIHSEGGQVEKTIALGDEAPGWDRFPFSENHRIAASV